MYTTGRLAVPPLCKSDASDILGSNPSSLTIRKCRKGLQYINISTSARVREIMRSNPKEQK